MTAGRLLCARLKPTPLRGKPATKAKPRARRISPSDVGAGSLTTGQLNAVRAAFKGGR